MRFFADLHIHSRFSLATSSQLTFPHLDLWGRKKGIKVIASGDGTHPAWTAEMRDFLVPAGNGFYSLKPSHRISGSNIFYNDDVYFILTAEISCIYKKDGAVRKVHLLVLANEIKFFEKLQSKLATIGNITSDGRPILGLDVRNLVEIVLSIDPTACCIPAHIWTPWFSVLGSKSGFDTIEACFGDLTPQIFALETGLSSDPPMNRRCSFLDRFTLISNSDAHSPDKLGREANIFSSECTYDGIMAALRNPSKGFDGTVEYFPEEGKYHLDGHRLCNVCWEPKQTIAAKSMCPVCGKPVTVGVLHRVEVLADRDNPEESNAHLPYFSLTSLRSIIAQRYGYGEQSKKVDAMYEQMLSTYGSEFSILLDLPIDVIAKSDQLLATGISHLRDKNVGLQGGYDGVFGKVSVFSKPGEV